MLAAPMPDTRARTGTCGVFSVAYSPDGRYLASAARQSGI